MAIERTNVIGMFLHCKRCIEERPTTVTPKAWARLSVGYTKRGIQIWCDRHEINVMHMDFQGHKHPATFSVANEAADKN